MITLKHFSNDLKGGVVAGIIALPLAIAFGVSSFAGIGSEFISTGVIAGLYGAVFTGIFAALFGGTPTQITGPTGPMAVITTSSVIMLWNHPSVQAVAGSSKIELLLFYLAMLVIFGGIFQIIFGISKLGKIVKYIPYPVIAGFMNGIAVIIFLGQIKSFLGFTSKTSYTHIMNNFGQGNFYIIVVGIFTIAAIILVPKIIKQIPSSLAGLIIGTSVYLLIGKFLFPDFLKITGNNLIIGKIPSAIPKPDFILNFNIFYKSINFDIIKLLIGPALTLGILGAIDSLLTSVVADVRTKTRHNSTKELIGQGLGNIFSGIFGGIPGAGATVRTLVNIDAGGKTNLSGIIHGIFLLLVVLVFGTLAKWIPMTVLAGILIITAVKMIDTWSISLIKKKTVIEDMLVMLTVTIITIVFNLMIAVGIGLLIACVLFIKKQIHNNPIKRIYSAKNIRSKKVRRDNERKLLEERGNEILIVELQGSLFFGNTDKFSVFIEKHITKCKFIIFDFVNFESLDLTGAQLLLDLFERLKSMNVNICLSGLTKFNDSFRNRVLKFMKEIGIMKEIGNEKIFYNIDYALEFCEDNILDLHSSEFEDKLDLDISDLELLKNLNSEELSVIKNKIIVKKYKSNDVIFKAGKAGDAIYFVKQGEVSIVHKLTADISKRIITYGPGAHFGEMAIIENKPRTATVIATKDCELYCLLKKDFDLILETDYKLGFKIIKNLCKFISNNLRITSKELLILSKT